MLKSVSILTLLLAGVIECAYSQSFYAVRRDRSLIFTAGTGTSTYFGELQNPGDILDARPNFNAGLQYFINSRLSARAEMNWFRLGGDDAQANGGGRDVRNLSFVSNNYEASLVAAVSLFPTEGRYYQRPFINFYGFAGLGLLYFNPKAELNDEMHALQPLMTEGVKYSRTQLVIPYGLGARLKMGPFFNLVVEGGYRMTFTDYLDDVSTVHPDKSTWTDPVRIALSDRSQEVGYPARAAGSIRGNPDKNDGYFLLNLKIEYYLRTNFLFKNASSRKLYRTKRSRARGR
jgi:hypothetical protein